MKPKMLSAQPDDTRQLLVSDVTAGITVAIMALPLGIAIAVASGADPAKGLVTAIVAGLLMSLVGGRPHDRLQSPFGPRDPGTGRRQYRSIVSWRPACNRSNRAYGHKCPCRGAGLRWPVWSAGLVHAITVFFLMVFGAEFAGCSGHAGTFRASDPDGLEHERTAQVVRFSFHDAF